jgi:hypothetical protein
MLLLLKKARIILLTLLVLSSSMAMAFDIPPPPPPFFQDLIVPLYYTNTNPTPGKTVRTPPKPASVATKPTLAPAAVGKPKGPAKLAAKLKLTPAQRASTIKAFEFSLNTYVKLEQALKIPKNDVAGALAAYLVGNYAAYYNANISNATFVTVVNQMRNLLMNIPKFKKATPLVKREIYEQWAIGGMFMYLANQELKKQPNKALALKVRTLAKTNLEKFLGVKVAKIRLNKLGLIILP